MGVERLGRTEPVGVPDVLDDVSAGPHGARILEEIRQQPELLGGECDLVDAARPLERDAVSTTVDGERTAPEQLIAEIGVTVWFATIAFEPAADGAHPSHQLAEPERLHHVIVRAQFEAEHAVELLAARGDDDDRDRRTFPDAAAHVVPVHVRQTQVEQHDVTELGLAVAGITYGGLLGAFFLGLFVRKARQQDAIIAFAIAVATMAYLFVFQRGLIGFTWFTAIGVAITMIIGGALSVRHRDA
jgi:hypothetical protein